MTKFTDPPLNSLKRRIDSYHRLQQGRSGMFVRQTFCFGRDEARAKART